MHTLYEAPRGPAWLIWACPIECLSDLVDIIPDCPGGQLRDIVLAINTLEARGEMREDLPIKRRLIKEYLED